MRDRGSKGSASSCRTSSMASSCRSTPTAAGSMVSATLWWKSTAKVLKSMQQQAVKERYHFIAFFWAQVVLVSNLYMSCVFSIRLLQAFFFLRVCHECPLVANLCGKSLLISAFISFFFCRRGVPVPGPFGSHLSAECSQSLGTCPHVQCDICKYISLNPLAPLPDCLFAYCLSFWAE